MFILFPSFFTLRIPREEGKKRVSEIDRESQSKVVKRKTKINEVAAFNELNALF